MARSVDAKAEGYSSLQWRVLALLFLARTAMAYQFQSVGSLSPFLSDALELSAAETGALIGLYLAPGIVIAIPSGVIGQRFGARNVVLAGLALMVIGGAMTASDVVLAFQAGRLASGVGAVCLNVLLTKMLADWFAGRKTVLAMSIFIMSWPFGIAMGLVSQPFAATIYSWQAAMILASAFAAASLLLIWWYYRDPPELAASAKPTLRIALSAHEWILTSIAGSIWGLYNVAFIVLVSFLPQFFMARGYELIAASTLVSLLGWFLIVTVPAGGMIHQRFPLPNIQMVASYILVAALAALLPFSQEPALLFAALSVIVGLPAGLIMSLPAEALSPANRAAGMGVFYTIYYLAMAFLPTLAGSLRDATGDAGTPTYLAAAMMLLASVCLGAFRILQRR